jgi:hypothetical protein
LKKDALVQAKVTGFEGKEDVQKKVQEHLPVGREFSFRFTVKGDTATLADLKGEGIDAFKTHVEGDFEKKK